MIATCLFVSLLIALFLPLRPLLRVAIGSQWLCILWLALLMRLLAPWPLHTPWGVMNRRAAPSDSPSLTASPLKVKVTYLPTLPTPQIIHPIATALSADQNPARSPAAIDLPMLTWLAGFLTALALLAWRSIQTARLARETQPVTDERLAAIFASIPSHLRRNVTLRMCASVQAPTLAGIVHPQIWMPPAWLAQFSDEELRCILLHEIGHARRGDLAVQCLFAIAGCLHWFNPLVWLASRAARLDREMACDAWVLSLNDDAPPAYGETLLKTVQLLRDPQRVPATMVAMASGRRSLRARIAGIGGFRPSRTWPGLLGLALMLGAIAIATSSRATQGETPTSAPAIVASSTPLPPVTAPATSPANTGPIIELKAKFVQFDEKAWAKFRADNADLQDYETSLFGDLDDKARNSDSQPGDSAPSNEQLAALKALGPVNWVYKDGAWQNVSTLFGETVLSDKPFQKILRYLDGRSGVDLLSAPKVTTRSGNRALIEVVREYRYPSVFEPYKRAPSGWTPTKFALQNLGASLEVSSTFETTGDMANTIRLDLSPEISDFLGFLPEKNGGKIAVGPMHPSPGYWRPIFSITRGRTDLNILPGQTVMLTGIRYTRRASPLNFEEPVKQVTQPDSIEPRVIVVFVTPTIVAADGMPSDATQHDSTVPPANAKLPYAIPVSGKRGFVTSPYGGGYIDVRGFPKDSQVKDPYTGKIFLVP